MKAEEQTLECVWTWEHDMGFYDAKCGGAYCFDDIFENLPEHNYNFCPKCGLKIRAVTPTED